MLTPDELRWYFGESESLLGVRSPLGSMFERRRTKDGTTEPFFCPMPRGNGAPDGEAALVRATRLRGEPGSDAIAKHRRIHGRLLLVPSEHLAVLRAAYGPNDWTRQLPPDVYAPIRALLGDLVNVAPLSAAARVAAARRMGPSGMPCAGPEEARERAVVVEGKLRTGGRDEDGNDVTDGEDGVRCVYRPSKPTAPAKEPSKKTGRIKLSPSAAAALLFQRDPALQASPRGAVISIACSGDLPRREDLVSEAAALLRLARLGHVRDPQPGPRRGTVQVCRNVGGARAT